MTANPSATEERTDTPGPAAPEHSSSAAPAGDNGSAGPEAGQGTSPATVEGTSTPSEGDAGGKRRVRLNPTFDPQRIKPIPTLTPGGSAAPITEAERSAPAVSPAAPAADEFDAEGITLPPAAPAPVVVEAPRPSGPPVEVPTAADLDAQMQAEIEAALASGEIGMPLVEATPEPVAPAAEGAATEQATEPATLEQLAEGSKISGTIASIHEDNVFIDFGFRLNGLVSLRQFSPNKPPKVGDRLQVIVNKVDEEEGLIACRLPRGTSKVSGDWHALSAGAVVDCLINKTNKGGLEVSVGSLRGFMPASQVELGYVADLTPFVGQKVRARVTEINPARRRLVVSRKALLQEERAAAEQELMAELQPGQTRPGRVKTIKDYGAFVDLGGIDGFLHIGQMSWVRINHPSEVISEGQEIEVKVLSIDPDKKKISLGMRQLAANPWQTVETRYPKGSTVTGKVTRTEPFGAFVELEPGVEGLVHISELDYKRVRSVTDVLKVGQTAQVQVLETDPQKKRISLSVKALLAKPEAAAPVEAPAAPAYERKRKSGLKGGIGGNTQGGLFGDPRSFG
jgi:small subunit ribosomal protein S1